MKLAGYEWYGKHASMKVKTASEKVKFGELLPRILTRIAPDAGMPEHSSLRKEAAALLL